MIWYISYDLGEEKGAFTKARIDAEHIMTEMGCEKFPFLETKNRSFFDIIRIRFYNWKKLIRTLDKDDTVIIQHPLENGLYTLLGVTCCKVIKKNKFVVLIHDLYSVSSPKKHFKCLYDMKDFALLKRVDKVISHNCKMSALLIDKGVEKNKLVNLEIFDYLLDREAYQKRQKNTNDFNSLVIAGNLKPQKAGYIYKFDDVNWQNTRVFLYGRDYIYKDTRSVLYKGQLSPSELPYVIEGSFGLVWDGNSLEKCEGASGNYLKINNPHKASMYLAAGIPLIVWNKSALSDFVICNEIGLSVNSIFDIPEILKNINDFEYKKMTDNVEQVSKKVQCGHFLKKALAEAIPVLSEQ